MLNRLSSPNLNSQMKKIAFAATLIVALSGANSSQATPLAMDYSISNGAVSGEYDYSFKITLSNNDNSWASGQSFNWIIFGDAFSAASPLAHFIINNASLPVGPFTYLTDSGGGHNGPTFLELAGGTIGPGWVPSAVGDSLTWSGISSANLSQGQLLFSNLVGTGKTADFEVATLVAPVPGPIAGAGLPALLGLLGLGLLYRRQRSPSV